MSEQQPAAAALVHSKTALQENKLRLTGDVLKGARRPATWQLLMFGNQLRVSCYTNVENDKNNGRIEAKMDSITAYAFMEQLELVTATNNPCKYFVECRTVLNGDFKNPVLESTLVCGRGEDNVVYVGIVSADEDRPRLQFRLRPTDFHALLGADRQPLPEALISEIYAKAYLRLMRSLCANVLDTHFKESDRNQNKPAGGFQKKPWQGNGGGGGGYNKGGNGGGFQKKPWQGNGGGGGGYNKGGNNNYNRGGGNSYQAPSEPEPEFESDDDLAF